MNPRSHNGKQSSSVVHPFPPFIGESPRMLILGSFPSVRSREAMFYYCHPQNRFWAVLARLFGEELPLTVDEKKALLSRHGIALWDVIASCRIAGSADSSITDVSVNDISPLLDTYGITGVFTNGKKAYSLYNGLILPAVGIEAVCLPSTSPANAAYSLEKLCGEWQKELFNVR